MSTLSETLIFFTKFTKTCANIGNTEYSLKRSAIKLKVATKNKQRSEENDSVRIR